jgi:hypothetical protein
MFAQPVKLFISRGDVGRRKQMRFFGTPCGGAAFIFFGLIMCLYIMTIFW